MASAHALLRARPLGADGRAQPCRGRALPRTWWCALTLRVFRALGDKGLWVFLAHAMTWLAPRAAPSLAAAAALTHGRRAPATQASGDGGSWHDTGTRGLPCSSPLGRVVLCDGRAIGK